MPICVVTVCRISSSNNRCSSSQRYACNCVQAHSILNLKCKLAMLKPIDREILRECTSFSDALPLRPGMSRSSCFCTCQIHVNCLYPSPPFCCCHFFALPPMPLVLCRVQAVLVVASFSNPSSFSLSPGNVRSLFFRTCKTCSHFLPSNVWWGLSASQAACEQQ